MSDRAELELASEQLRQAHMSVVKVLAKRADDGDTYLIQQLSTAASYIAESRHILCGAASHSEMQERSMRGSRADCVSVGAQLDGHADF